MKVDLTALATTQLADQSALTRTKERSTASVSDAAVSSGDRTTFSSAPNVPSLVTQALATPATRQDKVAALRQQVTDGTYAVSADNIVSALITSGGR